MFYRRINYRYKFGCVWIKSRVRGLNISHVRLKYPSTGVKMFYPWLKQSVIRRMAKPRRMLLLDCQYLYILMANPDVVMRIVRIPESKSKLKLTVINGSQKVLSWSSINTFNVLVQVQTNVNTWISNQASICFYLISTHLWRDNAYVHQISGQAMRGRHTVLSWSFRNIFNVIFLVETNVNTHYECQKRGQLSP